MFGMQFKTEIIWYNVTTHSLADTFKSKINQKIRTHKSFVPENEDYLESHGTILKQYNNLWDKYKNYKTIR